MSARLSASIAALLGGVLLGAAGPGAFAQTGPTSQDLYQDALQSIAEGRKNDASETLTRVIEQEPLHAGAWLDLALIQCALGHTDRAERLFEAIETRFDPPAELRAVIASTRAQGCARWQAQRHLTLSAGRGSDQNVNQGASNANYTVDGVNGPENVTLLPDFLPKHDQFTMASADYVRDLTPNGTIGFSQFQLRRNDHLHNYDSASLFTGIETPWRFGAWTLRSTVTLGFLSLGGQLYQRQAQAQGRIGPPLPLPGSTQFYLTGGITHVEYLTLSNFDGNAFELKGQLTHRNERSASSISAGWLDDRAIGARPGGNRHGAMLSMQRQQRLHDGLSGELGYTYQNWRSASAYSPGLIETTRAQRSQVMRAALVYRVDGNSSLQFEWRQVWNRENIPIFQYNNRQLQLSWQWHAP